MSKSARRIALFGGSFNPPHAGHYEIARRLARRRSIDEVWILPVYRHVLGKKLPPFERRLKAAREFFRPLHPRVKVKDLERRLGGPSYTIRLLEHLRNRHPEWKLSLAMGEDNYRIRGQWKDFDRIRRLARLIVVPRGPRSFIPDVSSTQMRKSGKTTRRLKALRRRV